MLCNHPKFVVVQVCPWFACSADGPHLRPVHLFDWATSSTTTTTSTSYLDNSAPPLRTTTATARLQLMTTQEVFHVHDNEPGERCTGSGSLFAPYLCEAVLPCPQCTHRLVLTLSHLLPCFVPIPSIDIAHGTAQYKVAWTITPACHDSTT